MRRVPTVDEEGGFGRCVHGGLDLGDDFPARNHFPDEGSSRVAPPPPWSGDRSGEEAAFGFVGPMESGRRIARSFFVERSVPMSRGSIGLDDRLNRYLADNHPPEHPVLAELRELTGKMPNSSLQIAPEQGHLLAFLRS